MKKLEPSEQGFDVMDPMFLFVGRLAVQKGPDLLLEAVKASRAIRY